MVPISPFFETNLSWLFFAPKIILTNISLSIVPMEKTETQRGEVTRPKSLSKLVTDMGPKSKPLAFQRALFSHSFPCFLWWVWPRGGCANRGPVSYSIGQGRGCSKQQGLISALEGPVGRGWSWSKVRGTLLLLRANTVIIQLRDERDGLSWELYPGSYIYNFTIVKPQIPHWKCLNAQLMPEIQTIFCGA